MPESLPVLNYNRYEETAFDLIPVLEGVVEGVIVFGVLSLLRAEAGVKGRVEVEPDVAYHGLGRPIKAVVQSSTGNSVEGSVVVISFTDAYPRVESDALASYLSARRRVLLNRGPATAVMLKHPPIPVQKPKPVPVPPAPEPKPAPVVPDSPITMTELLLQIAAMQTDFDLRFQVMAKRLAVLEAK
jgi:hypothetical protein